MDGLTTVVVAAILVLLLFGFFKIIRKPLKLVVKFLLNTLGGFISLILINFFGSWLGISIGVNWINAAVVGIFGLPGVALLLVLQWLLKI
jgi:inhibitor of the pro-sigma K processing machinery